MKLSEYIQSLQELIVEHPEAAEFEVFYATDDEGNDYKAVFFPPSFVMKDGQDFMNEGYFEDENPEDFIPNAIVVN